MIRAALLAAALALTLGCANRPSPRAGPYQPLGESARDPRAADRLNAEATGILTKDPAKAERLLREALTADLFHGPAHNNLGVLYLAQGRLYEAAGEFEWCRKLMPSHPDPRVNLAMTLERAGRTNEALSEYAAALEVSPEYVPAVQGLARLQVRAGKRDNRTPDLLRDIALRGENESWRRWARGLMSGVDP
jgi:tetratricopeptide (TPR) repeat protein